LSSDPKYRGAYAAVLGGVDAVGGGIGENVPVVPARICSGLARLDLAPDADACDRCLGTEEARISRAASMIDAHVIPVCEEEAIARTTQRCLTPAEETQ
jgi:acetate kinase